MYNIFTKLTNSQEGGVVRLDVTNVKIFLSTKDGSTKAYASVTFDEAFVVRDIRIVDGKNGLFVSMPARRRKNGEFQDICHPINTETRELIQNAILDKYKELKT
jgi:stage V sporulation protein G